jgi:PilZ domain
MLPDARALPIDRSMLPPPSAALMRFVRQRATSQAGDKELRRSKRYAVVLEVIVVPLNEHFRPSGLPFLAVTRDVSTGGLCLLHMRPAPSAKLFIQIERPNESALDGVLNVRRNRRLGQFYEIAGDFISIDAEALAAAKARVASRRLE